jgi:hypothetical protein
MYLTSARFDWVSDYAQFYLFDVENLERDWLEGLPAETFAKGFHVAPNALVIYTADCLRQMIEIILHDSKPPAVQDIPWTKQAETVVTFPSGRMALTSPTSAGSEKYGPQFALPAKSLSALIQWRESDEDRYNADRPIRDHIRVTLWPRL